MAQLAKPAPAQESAVRVAPRGVPVARAWAVVRAWPIARQFLLALVVLYLGKQILNVIVYPPFTGHDEVAHFSYLQTVASEHRVPVLLDLDEWEAALAAGGELPGDYLPDYFYRYCQYTLEWKPCHPDDPTYLESPFHVANWTQGVGRKPAGYQYLANHPPLYYIVMTPLFWLSAGASYETQHYLLRLAAIPFGLATVLLAYRMTRTLFPGDRFLAITVPTFVALQPQISYEAAMVNNDIVAIALVSLVLYFLVVGIRDRFPTRLSVLTGFAFGLAILAKGTSLTVAPLIALAMILGLGIANWRAWARAGSIAAGVAALLIWPWYLFLYRTYGNLDGFSQIQELQWWNYWGQEKPTFWELLWNRDFAVGRWRETWGEFGWRRIHLSDTLLWVIAIPCLVGLVGLGAYAVVAIRGRGEPSLDPVLRPRRWQSIALIVLFATCVVSYLAIIQFGTSFSLTQARYYFPAINAVALLLLLGFRTVLPLGWHRYGQAFVLSSLLLLNVVIYTSYIVPYRLEGWP